MLLHAVSQPSLSGDPGGFHLRLGWVPCQFQTDLAEVAVPGPLDRCQVPQVPPVPALHQDLPMSWLAGTKFAVFGLGDSTYSILAFDQECRWSTYLVATFMNPSQYTPLMFELPINYQRPSSTILSITHQPLLTTIDHYQPISTNINHINHY